LADEPFREGARVRRLARATQTAGEHRLMLAVLEDAVRIVVASRAGASRKSNRLVAETRQWLLGEDASWPFSFRNVCDVLGIDAQLLRARLSPWLLSWGDPF
jgi:hypothetical protein